MQLSDFQFEVPHKLIGLHPVEPRSSAKLLIYDRATREKVHTTFASLSDHLTENDLVVVNTSSVIPARFFGRRKSGGQLEGLFLKKTERGFLAWMKGRLKTDEVITLDGFGDVIVGSRTDKEAEILCDTEKFLSYLRERGNIPVPPYITAERERRGEAAASADDSANYQTVFAKSDTDISVAAPTASLHFDNKLMKELAAKKISLETISLGVGLGTFAPLEGELEKIELHSEDVSISPAAWAKILNHRKGRVIAVGTTVMRALESAFLRDRAGLSVDKFSTNLFIRPGFQFQCVQGLITNFHWPQTSLLVLVASFLEAQNKNQMHHDWRELYADAIAHDYRLFSYGDGMLIL